MNIAALQHKLVPRGRFFPIMRLRAWMRKAEGEFMKSEKAWTWRPPRVRHEPPTLEEAFAAAQDMTSDHSQQIEIAAGLLGISVEAVKAERPAPPSNPPVTRMIRNSGATGRTLVVERKVRRSAAASPRR